MDYSRVSLNEINAIITASDTVKYAQRYKDQLFPTQVYRQPRKHSVFYGASALAVLLALSALVLVPKEGQAKMLPEAHTMQPEIAQLHAIAVAPAQAYPEAAITSAPPPSQNKANPNQPESNPESPELSADKAAEAARLLALQSQFTEGIRPKTTSEQIALLQQRLMELNYLEHDEPTTYYGSLTENALQAFQQRNRLHDDGVATLETLHLLFSPDAAEWAIGVGAAGEQIRHIKVRLQTLGYFIQEEPVYDLQMAATMRSFQRINGLEQTGTINMELLDLIFSDDAIGANGEKIAPSYTQGTLDVNALVAIAFQQLDKKYVRGGKGEEIFDCSGLVYYCLNESGYSIRYMTSSGWRGSKFERIMDMDELQPGDICTFKGHVGIYIGAGKMIDASSSQGKVRISSNISSTRYWRQNWEGARRLL